jgi:hypothetical protein
VVLESKVGKSRISSGHMVTVELVNVSGRLHGLCVTGELELRSRKNIFGKIAWVASNERARPDM